jgi:hypothetical protein
VLTGAQARGVNKMTFDDLKKIFGIENVTSRPKYGGGGLQGPRQ